MLSLYLVEKKVFTEIMMFGCRCALPNMYARLNTRKQRS